MHRHRVCMLIPSFTPLVGGSEVQLAGLLERLDRRRVDPVVVTRRLPGTPPRSVEHGAPVVRLRAPLRPGTFAPAAAAWLWRAGDAFDVVHVHSLDSPALVGAMLRRAGRVRRYVQLVPRFGPGSSFDRLERTAVGRARLRYVLGAADAIIPLCPDAEDALSRHGVSPERIAPVPNGVDTDAFAPAPPDERAGLRRALEVAPGAFVGVVLARLIPRKNVAAALQAWVAVATAHPDAVLLVCGDGPERARLEAYARAHLRQAVRFLGNAPRQTVRRVLRAADVYLSFSQSEGMSNAMLEAMACGLPVLATRGPGIDALVRPGETGELLPPDDTTAAARTLRAWASRPRRIERMSRAARRRAVEDFSFDRVARMIEALYDAPPGPPSPARRLDAA